MLNQTLANSYNHLRHRFILAGVPVTDSTTENPCSLIGAGVFCVLAIIFLSGCSDSPPIDISKYQFKVKVISIEKPCKETWAGTSMGRFSYESDGNIFTDGTSLIGNPEIGSVVCIQTGCMGDCHNLIICPKNLK